jgi:PAS domain S-box-containing protein
VAVGVTASLLGFAVLEWQQQGRLRAEFEREASALATSLRHEVENSLEELENLRTFCAVPRGVDRALFRAVASRALAHHAGIRAFSWSPRVSAGERPAVEEAVRREGFPTYRFTERLPDGRLRPAAGRPEYLPVLYQEPYAGYEMALGFDNLSDPVRRATLENARDTGRASFSQAFPLAQNVPGEPSLLLFQPVYRPGRPSATPAERRAHLLGVVALSLNLGRLVRATLPDPEKEGLEYRLVEEAGTPAGSVFFASAGVEAAARAGQGFATGIAAADRRWRFEVYRGPGYPAANASRQPWLALGGGLALTLLGAICLMASARHTAAVVRLADDLRKISRAVEASPTAVMITDTRGAIEYVSPKFTQLTGYTREEALGQTPRILESDTMSPEEHRRLWAALEAGGEWRGEFRNRKKSGEPYWEAVSISGIPDAEGRITHFVAIAEDVSERKRVEAALEVRTHQLEAVRTIFDEIGRELNLPTVLRLVVSRAVEEIGCSSGVVWLWDDPAQMLVPAAWQGLGPWVAGYRLRSGEGVTGNVFERREGLIVNDYPAWRKSRPELLHFSQVSAVMAEPLQIPLGLLGVISLSHETSGRGFSEGDQATLRLFAAQAATAIERARLHEASLRRGERLESLLRSLKSVMSGLNLGEILDRLIAEAARIANTPHVKILLMEEVTQGLRVALAQGGTVQPGFAPPLGRSLSGRVVATGQPVFEADSQDESRNPNAAFDRRMGLRTYLGLPITGQHGTLGVIAFNTTEPRTYSDEELSYLMSFAAQAAIAIDNARLHEEVTRHAATLELRVQERTRDLEEARRVAEAATRAKTDFLLNMSHELRTPLNAVLGFAQVLEGQLAGLLNAKQARYLAHIHEGGAHLLELVEAILDLERVEAGQMVLQLEVVEVASLAEEAVALVSGLARGKRIAVHLDTACDLPSVWADPVRVKQILFNLLLNAVKFTPEGGTITVTVRLVPGKTEDGASGAERQGVESGPRSATGVSRGVLEVKVIDTGIGILAEDLLRLFQPFTQLDDPMRKRHTGTGLGLALSKRLVELHGGTIAVASEGEGKGCTFSVRLPLDGAGKGEA